MIEDKAHRHHHHPDDRGQYYLCKLLADGLSVKESASRLNISTKTVDAIRRGLIRLPVLH